MSEERWWIEEVQDEFETFTWNIMLKDGNRLRCVAQCLDESYAERIVSALKWVDALGSGTMKLAMEGITFNAKTGLVWERPKGLKSYDIKSEKTRPRTRKPRD